MLARHKPFFVTSAKCWCKLGDILRDLQLHNWKLEVSAYPPLTRNVGIQCFSQIPPVFQHTKQGKCEIHYLTSLNPSVWHAQSVLMLPSPNFQIFGAGVYCELYARSEMVTATNAMDATAIADQTCFCWGRLVSIRTRVAEHQRCADMHQLLFTTSPLSASLTCVSFYHNMRGWWSMT